MKKINGVKYKITRFARDNKKTSFLYQCVKKITFDFYVSCINFFRNFNNKIQLLKIKIDKKEADR